LVFYTKTNDQRSRLGIAVSKKFGNAVKRNLFKRKVREYFRKSEEISGKNLDILVSPNMKNIKRYSYDYSYIFSKIDKSMNEAIKKGFKR
jgi:ribonuclease P protein component|tara:strand:- start:15 stop:284 length:270 start_codon:yes stop_codon:yes gene_type:complete